MPVETNDCQVEREHNSYQHSPIESNLKDQNHDEQNSFIEDAKMQCRKSFTNTPLGVTLNAAVSSVSSTSSAHSSGDSNSQHTGVLLSSPNEMHSLEDSVVCSVASNLDTVVTHTTSRKDVTLLVEHAFSACSASEINSETKSLVNFADSDSCVEQLQLRTSDANHNLHALMNESEMSIKSSPISNKTVGQGMDSPDSAELPSMPSDKSDSHGNSDGRGPEIGEEITSCSFIGDPDTSELYTKSLYVKTNSPSSMMTPVESPSATTVTHPQTETMASLENTIDFVLDLIRNGRGMEVEFNASIRQQPQIPFSEAPPISFPRQNFSQNKIQTLPAVTPEDISASTFSNCQSSRQVNSNQGNVSGRRESSAHLANRQRIQSALDQATSSYFSGLPNNSELGQHSEQSGSHMRPMFPKHMSSKPNGYPSQLPHVRYPCHPNVNPNVMRMNHQQPMYMPSSYARTMPVRSQYPILHQQYRQHSPAFTGFSSVQNNPQSASVGTSYYSPPLLSPGAPSVRQFMHPRLSHQAGQQQLSPSSSTSPRAVSMQIGNHSNYRDQSGQLVYFTASRHYSPNYSDSSSLNHSAFPSASHQKVGQVMQPSNQVMQNSTYSSNPTQQQRFSQELYHSTSISHHQFPNKSQLMPPPMASVATPGKKRKMSMVKCKRNKSEKMFMIESNCQQMYTSEHFFEETLKRLALEDFSSLVQDPLVTTSISLIPPRGGRPLGNVVNGAEAEKSFSKSKKMMKYSQLPYRLRHPKPQNMTASKANGYLFQALPNLKPPEHHISSNCDVITSNGRSSTPDNPIPGTPEPADTAGEPMLRSFPFSKHCHLSGRTTPPLPIMYPVVFGNGIPSEFVSTNTPVETIIDNFTEYKSECKLNHGRVNQLNGDHLTTIQDTTASTLSSTAHQKQELKTDSNTLHNSSQSSKNLIARMLLDHEMSSKKMVCSDISRTRFLSNTSRYFEESITMASLIASKRQISCRHCEMLVDGSQSITKTLEELVGDSSHTLDSDKLEQSVTLCSVNCLTQFSKLLCGNNSTDFEDVIESFTHNKKYQNPYLGSDSSKVPILLQGRLSKFEKIGTKRHANIDRLTGKKHFNRHENGISQMSKPLLKRWRGVRWKIFSPNFSSVRFYKEIPEIKMRHILSQYSPQLRCMDVVKDSRTCILCKLVGDASEQVAGRMLNYGVDVWLHLNCALWCFEVYETVSGALLDVVPSVERALKTLCVFCGRFGAGLTCYRSRCPAVYHLPCAYDAGCMFFTDRGMYCPSHRVKEHPLHLPRLTAERRVFICRDESNQVANVVLDEGKNAMSLRIGSVILHQVGQVLPEQLASGSFNSKECIYPIGYHASRYYWSSRQINQRSCYDCTVVECSGNPVFVVSVQEPGFEIERHEDTTCTGAWCAILERIADLRKSAGLIKLFPHCLRGEYLFGLTEPHIVRAIESLPGVENLKNYAFKFGRMQLITEMPLAVNPTGSARSESKLRTYVRRSHCPVRHATSTNRDQHVKGSSSPGFNEHMHGFSRFVSGKTQQYRRLKYEWKFNVSLGRSRIQGLGLFAAREIEKFTLIIEYLGEVIRNEVANRREELYESQNRGVYMFRVNDDYIVDATMCGGLARYVNHSCEPNCSAEIITFDGGSHILILAKKKVEKGEELTYDYNFDYEDRSDKIPCLCGAASCRNWMN